MEEKKPKEEREVGVEVEVEEETNRGSGARMSQENYAHGCTFDAFVGQRGFRNRTDARRRRRSRRSSRRGRSGMTLDFQRPTFNTQFNTKFMASVSDDMRLTQKAHTHKHTLIYMLKIGIGIGYW